MFYDSIIFNHQERQGHKVFGETPMKRVVWQVAQWELARYFRWKDFLLFIALMIAGFVFMVAGTTAVVTADFIAPQGKLVVIGAEKLAADFSKESRFRVISSEGKSLEAWREAARKQEVDAVLTVISSEEAELFYFRPPAWQKEIQNGLNAARRRIELERRQLKDDDFNALTRSVTLRTVAPELGKNGPGQTERFFALSIMGGMFMAVVLSMSFQFNAITGEKTNRVSEMVLSAITPQDWMDGKILGTTAAGMLYVILPTIAGMLGYAILQHTPYASWLPVLEMKPWHLALNLALAVLGCLLWTSLFAGFAAMIDDPSSSSRSAVLGLPGLPVVFAGLAAQSPDNPIIRAMAFFPFTSSAILPIRLQLTAVPWWEPVVTLALLVGSIGLCRIAAARIFATAILMYGKEPTLAEIWRWLRGR
jgi:ABC-2 type transport system permease protein